MLHKLDKENAQKLFFKPLKFSMVRPELYSREIFYIYNIDYNKTN